MNNLVREKLNNLIETYSHSICTEPKRLEGLLKDSCGQYRLEINLLILAAREKIPLEIASSDEELLSEITIIRFFSRLRDEHGIADENASWAIESWALALGKTVARSRSNTTTYNQHPIAIIEEEIKPQIPVSSQTPNHRPVYITCPKCGYMNQTGSRYCAACSQKIESSSNEITDWYITCPHCGSPNPKSNWHCSVCSKRIRPVGKNETVENNSLTNSNEKRAVLSSNLSNYASDWHIICPHCGSPNPKSNWHCASCSQKIR